MFSPDFQILMASRKKRSWSPPKVFRSSKKYEYLSTAILYDSILQVSSHRERITFDLSENHNGYESKNISTISFCTAPEYAPNKGAMVFQKSMSSSNTLQVYVEIDYYTYSVFSGNVNAIASWVSIIFSDVAGIFAMENVNLQIKQIFIWDENDPYTDNWSLSGHLNLFTSRLQKNQLTGNIACLLSTKNLGGGKANVASLCEPIDSLMKEGPLAIISSLNQEYHTDQQYAWNTYLLAHEIGHIIGSPHTHACAWGPNNDHPLDDCFSPEGECSMGNSPTDGGTIMSYCNIAPSGINFANGFGQEPGMLIQQLIAVSSCLSSTASGFNCILNSYCNDLNECTINDRIDENCNCMGTLVDVNKNMVCDFLEPCPDEINLYELTSHNLTYMAKNSISSTVRMERNASIIFSAGLEINLNDGFEIEKGAIFEAFLSGCNKD
jgi:hypothetical protein